LRAFFDTLTGSPAVDLRLDGSFVRCIDPSELRNLSPSYPAIQPLRISLLAGSQWSIHKDLQIRAAYLPHLLARGAVRSDDGDQHHRPLLRPGLCQSSDSADILFPIGLREPEGGMQLLAYLIPIEKHRRHAKRRQRLLYSLRDRRFTRSAQSG